MEGNAKNKSNRGVSSENGKDNRNPGKSVNKSLSELAAPHITNANRSTTLNLKCSTNNTSELLKQLPTDAVDKNLDNVLEAVRTLDVACAYTKCKAKTNLMGQFCEYCKEKYCFKHGLPEIHGCGEAVKNDERKKFLHPKTMKTIRQEQDIAKAKKKLETKLKDMQVSRMAKNPGVSSGNSKKKK